MAHYLVTGGGGFIGSHIVDALLDRGDRVRVLDDFSTGRRANLDAVSDRVEVIEGSLCDPAAVAAALRGVDYVLHQAALPSVPRSVADPIRTHEVNATGTLNLLTAARDVGLKRLVIASSSSVYGENPELPKREDMVARPLSPYAVSKLAAESYGVAFHRVYGLPVVALRYFNVFGPRQDPASTYSGVVAKLMTCAITRERPVIHGDGLQSRDFTYVSNVVAANLAACARDEALGQVINVACGEATSVLAMLHALEALEGRAMEPQFEPSRKGDVKHSLAAIGRAERLLGYRPAVSWVEGLRRTLDWYRSVGTLAEPVAQGGNIDGVAQSSPRTS